MTHYLDIKLGVDLTEIVSIENYSGAKELLGASDDDFLLKYSLFLKAKIIEAVSELKNVKFLDGSFTSANEQSTDEAEAELVDTESELKKRIDNYSDNEVHDVVIPTEEEIFVHDYREAEFRVYAAGGEIQDVVFRDADYMAAIAKENIIVKEDFANCLVREDLPSKAVIRYKDLEGKIREERVD